MEKKDKTVMPRLTNTQFQTLFALQDGHANRCSYGNPSHTALFKRGLVSIRFVSRRDYLLTITPDGIGAVQAEIWRKARQKSTLHT
jgi:hypothetical protein